MLEKFKRKKELANQDRKIPQTIQELIKRYDLGNVNIIDFLDYLVSQINEDITSIEENIENNYILKKNIARGNVSITPSASNTPTSKAVTWSQMDGKPTVVATPNVTVPGTVVTGVSVTGGSSTGATIWVTRTTTTATVVNYVAVYE